MAKTTTLNAKNLEALGPERLAGLLIEITTGNALAKRRLRMELAGAQSPGELGKEVRKRLAAIGRARSFVDWHGVKPLAADLEAQWVERSSWLRSSAVRYSAARTLGEARAASTVLATDLRARWKTGCYIEDAEPLRR